MLCVAVETCGGKANAAGRAKEQLCSFPFMHEGQYYDKCQPGKTSPQVGLKDKWCKVKDGKWAACGRCPPPPPPASGKAPGGGGGGGGSGASRPSVGVTTLATSILMLAVLLLL